MDRRRKLLGTAGCFAALLAAACTELSVPATAPDAGFVRPRRDAAQPLADAGAVADAASTPDASAPDASAEPDAGPLDAGSPPDPTPRTVMVHLFEWPWEDIGRECELVLGPAGFAAVQVSPPQEHAVFDFTPWWQRYQPVSYQLVSRSGDRAQFAAMVERCANAGVHVYVDAVINHMSFQEEGVGSGGTSFTRYSYPGLYEEQDFHDCRRPIEDFTSRWEIFNCDLATTPDLDTGSLYVRSRLAGYLDDLLSIGVAGFRIDGAKHIDPVDLAAILNQLDRDAYVYQEVIDLSDAEVVPATEYYATGDVTEFRYGLELSRVFRTGQLAWLESFGPDWGFMPSDVGIAFVDNHDNQRGHGAGDPLSFQDGRLHELAVLFMLAWPYGYPRVMSSYAFTDGTHGPPSDAAGQTTPVLDSAGDCSEGWVCEHRRPAVLGMVGFRNATSAAFVVENWWSNGNDEIAFSRGDLGFFALNREEASGLTETLETGMVAGRYCDVTTGELRDGACTGRIVEVGPDGRAEIVLDPLDALAIHVGVGLD